MYGKRVRYLTLSLSFVGLSLLPLPSAHAQPNPGLYWLIQQTGGLCNAVRAYRSQRIIKSEFFATTEILDQARRMQINVCTAYNYLVDAWYY